MDTSTRPRIALLLTTALLAGCGSASHAPPSSPSPSLQWYWRENAQQFIAKLETDVLLSANGGANVATARRALSNTSDLFGMVLAYTDFAGCGELLRSFGRPAPADEAALPALGSACTKVEEAAALFRQAIVRNDPRILLTATRAALAAEPLLVRAKAAIAR